MQVFSFIKKAAPILIGFLFLWIGMGAYSSLLNQSNKELDTLIPEKANFVFRMNMKDFVKSSTYSIIFNSKDQVLLTSFEAYLNKQNHGTGKSDDFGIDYTADLTIFSESVESGENYVMLLNLLNPEKFNKNLPAYLESNQSFLSEGNIGMIVTHYGKKPLSRSKLKSYLESKAKHRNSKLAAHESGDFCKLELKQFQINDKLRIEKGEITSFFNEELLTINGKLKLEEGAYQISDWTLKTNGIHIENALFSPTIQDSIQAYLSKIGISTPSIGRISINYYGMELQDTDKGMIFTPVFDILMTFNSGFSMAEIFRNTHEIEKYGFVKEGNRISAGKVNFTLDSLDSHNLFIGINPKLITKQKSTSLFSLKGDLKKLTRVNGGGMIGSFISSLPPLESSRNLFESIGMIHLEAKTSNKDVRVGAQIKSKKGHYLYNEFLKFFLVLKGEM